jgi:GWxTD domain-containing protein
MRHDAIPARAWYSALSIVAMVGAVCVSSSPLGAQRSRVRPPTDSLVREALGKADAGDTATALDLLEQATDHSPRNTDALYWRGLMLSRTTTLSMSDTPRRLLAGYLLNRANDIDPRNPRYLIELGRIRLKTPILRVEAERLFRKALEVAESSGDPAQVADVAYELGQIKARRYLTGRDRWMYRTPGVFFDPIAAHDRLHYTREFLENLAQPIENSAEVDRKDAEEYFRRALVSLPTHAPSMIALMGLLYDQRRYDEMRRVGAPLAAIDTAPPRLLMAMGLATYKLAMLKQADTLFTRAVARFSIAERLELTNLGRITRVGDSVRIDGLNDADRARTDSAFWEAADPLLATPENEARLEYMARLAFSDLRFSDDDLRQVGWKTDRGLIVARYGEPPVVATFAPSSDADARDAVGRVVTVWYYPRTDREFVFTGPPAMNFAIFAGNHRGYTEQNREDAPFLLDNLPIALAMDTMPVQIVRFRGPTAKRGELLIAASLPTDHLYKTAEIDRGTLETSVRIGPLAEMRLAHIDTMSVTIPVAKRAQRVWVDTLNAGGDYRVRVEMRDPALANAGRAHADLTMLAADTTKLATSDLMMAYRRTATNASDGRWRERGLVPMAELVVAPRDTFTVYWEMYGLRPDNERRVKYEVRLVISIEQIERTGTNVGRFLGNLGIWWASRRKVMNSSG